MDNQSADSLACNESNHTKHSKDKKEGVICSHLLHGKDVTRIL